jgi:hypothetical protein
MDAALIGKGRMPLKARMPLEGRMPLKACVPLKRKARSLAGDVAFQLLDVLGLFLDDGFYQITDR